MRSNSEQEKLSRGVKKLRNLTNIDFQGDGSLDALLLELLERTNVFWTPHMTDYLWKPIGLLVDPMEDVRKLRNHP